MSVFNNIFFRFYPEIDISKGAFEHPSNRTAPINEDFLTYSVLSALHYDDSKKQKFSVYYNTIVPSPQHPEVSKNKREILMENFSNSQKYYNSLCRFARLWKIKKARLGSTDCDLYMNPLGNFKKHLIMSIYDDATRTLYKFRLSDLMSIAKNSLSNSPDFFADPQEIRNPYTNVPFTKAQLYSIYFYIKEVKFDMPILFSQFYKNHFNLDLFCDANECYIRQTAIDNFINSGSDPEKYYYITKLLRDYRSDLNGVSVHPGFPPAQLIKTFSIYLKDYLSSLFSLNPGQKYRAKVNLQKQLKLFGHLNPDYGRKVIKEIESNDPDIERPEYQTSYIYDVNLSSPVVTPRAQSRRRTRMLENNSTIFTPELPPRDGRIIEYEPIPNDEEANQRAEAGAYRAARELERAEEAINDITGLSSSEVSERTVTRLTNLRNRINQVTDAVSNGEINLERDTTNAYRQALDNDEDYETIASTLREARRRPLPRRPTATDNNANVRALLERYRTSRLNHPQLPELTDEHLGLPPQINNNNSATDNSVNAVSTPISPTINHRYTNIHEILPPAPRSAIRSASTTRSYSPSPELELDRENNSQSQPNTDSETTTVPHEISDIEGIRIYDISAIPPIEHAPISSDMEQSENDAPDDVPPSHDEPSDEPSDAPSCDL